MPDLPLSTMRCPVSRGPLRRLLPPDRERINELIRSGAARHRDGTPVQTPVNVGLIADQADLAYRIDDGIASLLPAKAIVLGERPVDPTEPRTEKRSVQAFYDEVGWKKTDEDLFVDTARFVDGRPIVQEYFRECRLRIGRHLPDRGNALLDVASGPVQFPEYVDYQAGFQSRICVDISGLALREARGNVGAKGVFVQGDITNLPLADDSIDAVISLHTIYHVPRDEQTVAFCELHRVLRPGGVGVIAYSWGHTAWSELSWARRILHLPGRIAGRLRREVRGLAAAPTPSSATTVPELYFHAFDYHWFVRYPWPFRAEILAHRMFTSELLKRLVHERLLGRQLLAVINGFENRFPRTAGRFGRYPLIVIHKD